MPSISVHVECHDPKGLSERYYNFGGRLLTPAKYTNMFNVLQRRLEQDVSADTGVKINVQLNPGPGPGVPSACSSASRLECTEDGWFVHRREHNFDKDVARSRYPRPGAFEVVVVDPVGLGPLTSHFKAFSKIGTGKWPLMNALCNRLKQVLEAAQSGDAQEVGRIIRRMQQISEGGGDASAGMHSGRCASVASAAPHRRPLLPGVHRDVWRSERRALRRAARPGTAVGGPGHPAGAVSARFPSLARPSSAGALRPAGAVPSRPRSVAEPQEAAAVWGQQVLKIESLSGFWRSADPADSVLVEGGRVMWASRPGLRPWSLRAVGHDRVILHCFRRVVHGALKEGKLVWDDGDVWVPHEQAGHTVLHQCALDVQAADTPEVDSTAMTMEGILDQQAEELIAVIGDLAMEAPSGQTPVLKDLVGRLFRKHGESARPRDIVSQLRELPTLEEQLDKDSFKAPLYSLGVKTDTPLNLSGLFAELSCGSPPMCSMSMLIDALDARWPTVAPLPSTTACRGSPCSSESDPSESASVSPASGAGRWLCQPGPRAGLAPARELALREWAQATPAKDVEDDAFSDDNFEVEEARPGRHLEELSTTFPAVDLLELQERVQATPAEDVEDDSYSDDDFEAEEAGPGQLLGEPSATLPAVDLLELQERVQATPAEDVEDDSYSDDDFEAEEEGPGQHLGEPSAKLPVADLLEFPERVQATPAEDVEDDSYSNDDFEAEEARPGRHPNELSMTLSAANLVELQEWAEATPSEEVEDNANSDDDFEAEEAGPGQHLEESSATLLAANTRTCSSSSSSLSPPPSSSSSSTASGAQRPRAVCD